jgi:hypothetical protein
VKVARFLTAGSIPAKLEYVVRLSYIQTFFHFRESTYFKRDTRFMFAATLKKRQMTSSKNQPFSCQCTMVSGAGVQGIHIDLQGARTGEPMALR